MSSLGSDMFEGGGWKCSDFGVEEMRPDQNSGSQQLPAT